MTTIILIIHIVLALAIIGLVLLQRGTGGGLGLGESGGMGQFATPRSAANILTKATTWCAILFFATSLALAVLASNKSESAVMDELKAGEVAPSVPASTLDMLPSAQKKEAAPEVPTGSSTAPAPSETPKAAPEAPTTP